MVKLKKKQEGHDGPESLTWVILLQLLKHNGTYGSKSWFKSERKTVHMFQILLLYLKINEIGHGQIQGHFS